MEHKINNIQNGTEDVHSNRVAGVKQETATLITKGTVIPNTITHNSAIIASIVVLIMIC